MFTMGELEAAQWIWLAGLLEGEGYFGATDPGNGRRLQLKVSLNMTDEDVVLRAAAIVNGNAGVYRRDKGKPNWSDQWTVQWTGADAERIMHKVLPLMGRRRAATIRTALATDCGHRRKSHCLHGHEFTAANIRWEGNGRKCRACERQRNKRRKRKGRSDKAVDTQDIASIPPRA
jgi:hypothetical protein